MQNPSLKIKELKAQVLYRLERYEECFAVYRDIIKNSHDDYEEERETNLAAVLGNLAIEGSVSSMHFRKLLIVFDTNISKDILQIISRI